MTSSYASTHSLLGTPGPLRILLIEDNPGDALLLQETLHEVGLSFEMERVGELQPGIDLVQTRTFDLVMLDLSLPDSSGTATVARASKAFWKIPLIVLTSLDDDQMGVKALQFGAQDYLVKSQVTAPLLLRSIRYAKARHREREVLLRASLIDELTGLYNRRGFSTVAREELSLGAKAGRSFLVVFADLDGLKPINDVHGHAAGDWAIGKAAESMKLCFGPEDIVGRIGGDEFVALADGSEPGAEERLRREIAAAMEETNRVSKRPYRLSTSLGFYRPPVGEAVDLEELLNKADEALYEAKRARPKAVPVSPAA